MSNITIIGSDSFIASNFILTNQERFSIKLFSRIESGKIGEIIKPDLFEISQLDFNNCDYVLNFAAIVHQPGLKDNSLYEKINTKLPIHLANEAKKAGVKHFIQMSTIAIYGNTSNININTPENPVNIYGQTKLIADKNLLALQDETFKVSIIRPPMVYGGGNAPGNMMKLIKFAQKGLPLPFKGVKNSRDFIHVQNLVQALNIVIDNSIKGIVIPTDKKPVSTEKILIFVKKYSRTRVRLIKVPMFIILLLKKIKPELYNKVFGSLNVSCNLADNIYKPSLFIEDGIKEMILLNPN